MICDDGGVCHFEINRINYSRIGHLLAPHSYWGEKRNQGTECY